MLTSMLKSVTLATIAAIALSFTSGCETPAEGSPESVQLDPILSDLTPELMTLDERDVDVDINYARTANTNNRNFWEDMGRFFMTDRPSRLTPDPIP